MMELLGYDAVTVGEREFNYSYAYLKELTKDSDLVVSANIRDKETEKHVWDRYKIVDKKGYKVAITGVTNPNTDFRYGRDSLTIDDPLLTLQELMPELERKSDVVVVLAHLGRTESYDLTSQVEGIDVVVVGHRPSLVLRSREMNNAIAVSSGTQGQNIGETLLTFDGKEITQKEGRVVILMPTVGERADIAKLQNDFEAQLNETIRKKQQEEAVSSLGGQPGSHRFMGMDACISCHQPQYDQWKTTAHAHAFQTLVDQSKEATPDCVQCHVTGWNEPGGYQNQVTTAKMKDVQCEVCHGMGTQHNAFDEVAGPPSEELCLTCHTPENDPSWNYAAKLPKVVH